MKDYAHDDPNIPADLKKWPLFAAYEAEFGANPPGKDSAALGAHTAFVQKAHELFAVKCRACWGWGHVAGYCASLPRLKAACVDVQVTSWLSKAVTRPHLNLKGEDKVPTDKLSLASLPYRLPDGYRGKDGMVKKSCLRP